MYLITFEV